MRRSVAETGAFLSARAEEMRWSPTPAEAKLWEYLGPLGFKNQVPIYGYTKNSGVYPYVLDLYHPGAKLAIEADGGCHSRQRGRDRRRDTRLAIFGIKTVRFSNRRCLNETAKVINEIDEELRERLGL